MTATPRSCAPGLVEHVQGRRLVDQVIADLYDVKKAAGDQRPCCPGFLDRKAQKACFAVLAESLEGIEEAAMEDSLDLLGGVHAAVELQDIDIVGPQPSQRSLEACRYVLGGESIVANLRGHDCLRAPARQGLAYHRFTVAFAVPGSRINVVDSCVQGRVNCADGRRPAGIRKGIPSACPIDAAQRKSPQGHPADLEAGPSKTHAWDHRRLLTGCQYRGGQLYCRCGRLTERRRQASRDVPVRRAVIVVLP